MKRELLKKIDAVLPTPYVHCPFTANGNDIYGHLFWATQNDISYSQNGAAFNGTSSYMQSYLTAFSYMKTITFDIMFNRIPVDGNTSTWMTPYYVTNGSNETKRLYSYFQHYRNENVEITNCAQGNTSFSIANNVVTIPYGTGQTNTWYRLITRTNQDGSVDLYIDNYHKKANNAAINDTHEVYFIFGKKGTSYERYHDGYIRNFIMWDTVLTDDQISLLQNS